MYICVPLHMRICLCVHDCIHDCIWHMCLCDACTMHVFMYTNIEA